MRRTFTAILAVMAAAVLFAGLVYSVLVVAHLSDAGATTVYGLTARRLWATSAAVFGLLGVIGGWMALTGRIPGTASARQRAIVTLGAGLVAAINGGLNLTLATGGPGTGNGVVGGAAALVLGLIALVLGTLALVRRGRTALEQMT